MRPLLLEKIEYAYRAPDQRGSVFTAPLRSFHVRFEGKIASTELKWAKTALKAGYFVATIIATLLLGVPALVGIGFNLKATPLLAETRAQDYSIWAQIWGVPSKVEKLISKLSDNFEPLLKIKGGAVSRQSKHTYSQNKKLRYRLTNSTITPVIASDIRDYCRRYSIALESYEFIHVPEKDEGVTTQLQIHIPDSLPCPTPLPSECAHIREDITPYEVASIYPSLK